MELRQPIHSAWDYKVAPDVLTYVAVRSAYKAGGLNSQLPAGSAFATFRPEELKDVEVGIKGEFKFDGMAARVNLDVFRGDYTNIQRTTNVVSNGVFDQCHQQRRARQDFGR